MKNHVLVEISKHVKKGLDDCVLLPPPVADKCKGEIEIGQVSYAGNTLYPFGLNLKDINRHVGIFGSTGSGKTTCAVNLITNLRRRGVKFLLFANGSST